MFNKTLAVWLCPSVLAAAEIAVQRDAADRQRDHTQSQMAIALQQQKTSIRQQLVSTKGVTQSVGEVAPLPDFFMTDALTQPASNGDCEALSQLQVQSLAERAGESYGLRPDLIRAVMKQESAFRPCAVSNAGAVGLMQLMPATAQELAVSDPYDPESNVFGGAKLLRKLIDRYGGDLYRALGAYNAGPAKVDRMAGIPEFPETRTYVDTILGHLLRSEPPARAIITTVQERRSRTRLRKTIPAP